MATKEKNFKRKRNKSYYCGQNKKQKRLDVLAAGLKGFLITCNEKNGHVIVSEAYGLLNEYADILYGPENPDNEAVSSENEEDESIEKALSKEIKVLKDEKLKERRFQVVKDKIKNVVFIKTNIEDPNELAESIFTDLERTKLSKTRRCMRFLPIISTCHASEKAIISNLEHIFSKLFEKEHTASTYCIVFKARCNSSIKKDDIIPDICQTIRNENELWTVNYESPDYVLAIEVIANVCAIGLLKDYHRFKKYNLQSVVKITLDEPKKVESSNVCDSSSVEKPVVVDSQMTKGDCGEGHCDGSITNPRGTSDITT